MRVRGSRGDDSCSLLLFAAGARGESATRLQPRQPQEAREVQLIRHGLDTGSVQIELLIDDLHDFLKINASTKFRVQN